MKIYRAMNKKEAVQTIQKREPQFESRFKFFTPDFEFIKVRVKDGEFANSKYKKDKYVRVICFEISDEAIKHFKLVGNRELMIDRRVAHLFNWKVSEVIFNVSDLG